MKLLSLVLFTLLAYGAHAQVPADAGLPSTGESSVASPPPDAPPVQNPKEFNQDLDDFEKKISKEVPPENGSSAAGADKNAEKARAKMKEAHDNGGEPPAPPKSGIAAHKEAMAAKKATAKKSPAKKAGKASSAAAKKSTKGKAAGKKTAKKAPAKKKKKPAADE
jgi:hypothetical protein